MLRQKWKRSKWSRFQLRDFLLLNMVKVVDLEVKGRTKTINRGVKSMLTKFSTVFVIIVIIVFSQADLWSVDWKFYGYTGEDQVDATTNTKFCSEELVSKDKAAYSHYYDRESIIHPYKENKDIIRVWEKTVILKETISLKKLVKEWKENQIKREQEIEREKIPRKEKDERLVMMLQYDRPPEGEAIKESMVLNEINCAGREYKKLETNSYDKEGEFISHNTYNTKFIHIRPGSFIEGLYKCVCK